MRLHDNFITALAKAPTGASFQISVPVEQDVYELRQVLVEASGRAVTLHVRFGPLAIIRDAKVMHITCPIEAVDDLILTGDFSVPFKMESGHVLYEGSIIEKSRRYDA